MIETLLRASQTELELERWPEAIDLRALTVAREGEHATGRDYAELAAVYYKGLDVENADRVRKEAEARGPAAWRVSPRRAAGAWRLRASRTTACTTPRLPYRTALASPVQILPGPAARPRPVR